MTVLQSGSESGSVVSITTRRRAVQLTNRGSDPAVIVQLITGALYHRAKRPECEPEHSPSSSAKISLWHVAFLSVICQVCTNFSPKSFG